MKLFFVAAAAYALCLQCVFPGYLHPLYPHHDDFYFPPGLSFDGHTIWEKLQWPRPAGFLMMQALGKLGLKGYLFALVLVTLANAVLTVKLAERVLGRNVSWFLAFVYCVLLFAHPDFYVNYLHDAFGTLSYFYLIVMMHAWYRYRENGKASYLSVCAALILLLAFIKETYFIAALVFWIVQMAVCHGQQRRAAVALAATSAGCFGAGLFANAYSLRTVIHLKVDAASPYHVSLAPVAVARAFFFYLSRLFHPAVLALVIAGIAARFHKRDEVIFTCGLAAAGVCALLPYAVLPNHLDSMYAWTGATLAFSPVLFLPPQHGWRRTSMVYGGVAMLVLLSIVTGRARYDEQKWTVAQQQINRNIIHAYPVLKGLEASAKNILIAGLGMPFQPFHTPSYIRAEFGPERRWTVIIPRGATMKSEAPVRFSTPDGIQLGDYDRAVGFDDEGRLVSVLPRERLAKAMAPGEADRILFPELLPLLDELSKNPDNWSTLLRAGIVYSKWGALDRASELLERSVRLDRDRNPYPLFFLGQVRESQGKLEEARECYAQAVARDVIPSNPAFRESLERVTKK